MKLKIKSSSPYVEKKVKAASGPDYIIVGVKAYTEKELEKIRKEFFAIPDKRVDRLNKQAELLSVNLDLSEEDMEDQLKLVEEEKETLMSKVIENYLAFYKKHILYLKEVKLSLDDENLNIPDTREVKPIESLWGSPSECLDALLDLYLDDRNFKDSLINATLEGLFGINLNEVRVKN